MHSLEGMLTPEWARATLRRIGLKTGSPIYDEDLVQEALLRGVIACRRTGHIPHPKVFFTKIVRDTLYDHWRKRRVRQAFHSFADIQLSDTFSVDEHIDRNRQLEMVVDALDYLNENERHLINLFYFHELPIVEICKVLGKSSSAVKTGLSRSRKRILQFVASQCSPV